MVISNLRSFLYKPLFGIFKLSVMIPNLKNFRIPIHRKMSTIPTTQNVIYFQKNGGPEVLEYVNNYPVPSINDNEILIKNKFTGINFIEVYFRKGIYPCEKPYVPGREASGTIVSVGKGVKGYEVGDKVAYLSGSTFAQFTKVPEETAKIVKLPKDATDETLKAYTASLLQGLTALTFIHEAYDVKKNDYILVTAAAGGVGLLFCQLIGKLREAHVIAISSSDEKLDKAKASGAEYLLNSSELSQEELISKILDITNGEGVHASFDSVGKDTFELSLAVVRRKGTLISYGNASGAVPPFSINRLSPKNLKLLRPQLFGYVTEPKEFDFYTKQLFGLIDDGKLKIDIYKTYPLKDYPSATKELEGRKTTGKLILEIPQ